MKHECPMCAAKFECDGGVTDEPTLRDLFAAMAPGPPAQGLQPDWMKGDSLEASLAKWSYRHADAMLEARKKR